MKNENTIERQFYYYEFSSFPFRLLRTLEFSMWKIETFPPEIQQRRRRSYEKLWKKRMAKKQAEIDSKQIFNLSYTTYTVEWMIQNGIKLHRWRSIDKNLIKKSKHDEESKQQSKPWYTHISFKWSKQDSIMIMKFSLEKINRLGGRREMLCKKKTKYNYHPRQTLMTMWESFRFDNNSLRACEGLLVNLKQHELSP